MKKYLQGTAASTQYQDGAIIWNFDAEESGKAGLHPVLELTDEIGALLVASGGIQIPDTFQPINLHERP
jgi:hypothetical protein